MSSVCADVYHSSPELTGLFAKHLFTTRSGRSAVLYQQVLLLLLTLQGQGLYRVHVVVTWGLFRTSCTALEAACMCAYLLAAAAAPVGGPVRLLYTMYCAQLTRLRRCMGNSHIFGSLSGLYVSHMYHTMLKVRQQRATHTWV